MVHSDLHRLHPSLAAAAPLRAVEISAAEALVAEAGWNQTERDWRIFLDFGTVQALRSDDGRVIATAATLPYGGFGWISMVLVTATWRRRGLASVLLRGAIDGLTGAGLVPVLDATPAGRMVYRTLGFEDTWGFARFARPAVPLGPAERPATAGFEVAVIADAMWPSLCTYDAAAFGADRSRLLGRMRGRLPAAELCVLRAGRLVGFLLGREGRVASHLGPLVADDTAAAAALLGHALAAIPGPIFIDLADSKHETRALIESHGFASTRPLTRMVHGRSSAFDDGVHTFAVVGPEFG